tara:strand:+ start:223 stop:831 length:609 start_codon:yes stop_codon:yes gene_type:complete
MGYSITSFKNYHFKIWVPLLFLLLALVPILITCGFVLIAKISGIMCLFSLLIALWYWKVVAKNINSKTVPVSISLNDAYFLERNLLCYKSLNSSDKKTFNSRMGLFLAEIKAQNTSNAIISKEDWLSLASIIVILFWDKDYSSFSGYTFIWGEAEQNTDYIYIDRDNLISSFNSLSKIDIPSCSVEIKSSNKLSFIKNLLVT